MPVILLYFYLSWNNGKEPKNPVKVEVNSKKTCAHAVCSLGSCNSEKIPMTIALMHFSKHQMKGDADTCVCAFCGSADGHMPELNRTGKSICFQVRVVLLAIRWMRRSWRPLNARYRWRITQWNVPHAANPFRDSTWRTISPLAIHKK